MNFGGLIAADAVEALAKIIGPSFKPTLLALLVRKKDDFNFVVNGIAPALMPLIEKSDLPHLIDIAVDAASVPGGDAIANVLSRFHPDLLIAAARAQVGSPLPSNLVAILCRAFRERKDKRSFEILADFVLESEQGRD